MTKLSFHSLVIYIVFSLPPSHFLVRFRRIVAELRLQGEACNVLTLCRLREECLRAAGFDDLFTRVKSDENAAALALLPSVLRHIDKIKTSPGRMKRALTGVSGGGVEMTNQYRELFAWASRRASCHT